MEIVPSEGTREVRREMEYYNLDAITAVGYRVNSCHSVPPLGHEDAAGSFPAVVDKPTPAS